MAESTSSPAEPCQHQQSATGRVLVIAGTGAISGELERCLIERNCIVDRAAGSADALRRLRRVAYDVIFTDPPPPSTRTSPFCLRSVPSAPAHGSSSSHPPPLRKK